MWDISFCSLFVKFYPFVQSWVALKLFFKLFIYDYFFTHDAPYAVAKKDILLTLGLVLRLCKYYEISSGKRSFEFTKNSPRNWTELTLWCLSLILEPRCTMPLSIRFRDSTLEALEHSYYFALFLWQRNLQKEKNCNHFEHQKFEAELTKELKHNSACQSRHNLLQVHGFRLIRTNKNEILRIRRILI